MVSGASASQAYRLVKNALETEEIPDAAFDASQLIRLVLGVDWRVCPPDTVLTAPQADQLAALTHRRAAHEPLQYLCGTWDFLDMTLSVGTGVLIPRADTEIVCETAIAAARAIQKRTNAPPFVADLCSGSGAIAIGVARALPEAAVTAVELSDAAMPYLTANTAALAPQVRCVQADVFTWQTQCEARSFDVIVSNPPYISAQEMETLAPELAYEPRMALEADENGMAFYRHIPMAYRSRLRPGGAFVLEIGSTQAEAVCSLLRAAEYEDIRVLQDLGNNPRCVVGYVPIG